MTHCPRIENCTFFQEELYQKATHLIQSFRDHYCQGRFTDCACYQIASTLGDQYVPSLMLPTQIEWAQEILKENTPPLPA